MVITGKGYPDYNCKKFIHFLSYYNNLPIFYLGDADPFGADIYLNYAFGSHFINQ